MERTQEQIAADDNLTAAIERVAHAYGSVDEGEMLVTYIISGFSSSFEMVDNGESRMVLVYKDGEMSLHEAAGLLSLGYDYIAQQALSVDGEEYVWSLEDAEDDDETE